MPQTVTRSPSRTTVRVWLQAPSRKDLAPTSWRAFGGEITFVTEDGMTTRGVFPRPHRCFRPAGFRGLEQVVTVTICG
jgi:hypothetical protein